MYLRSEWRAPPRCGGRGSAGEPRRRQSPARGGRACARPAERAGGDARQRAGGVVGGAGGGGAGGGGVGGGEGRAGVGEEGAVFEEVLDVEDESGKGMECQLDNIRCVLTRH